MKKAIELFFPALIRDITTLGGFVVYAFLLIAMLLLQEYVLFWKLLFGLIIMMAAVILIRLFYFKNRPLKQMYHNLMGKIDASSFPSLHTARIMFIAATLIGWLRSREVVIFLMILVLLVAYSRMYLKKHDLIDIIGGILLGILTYVLSFFI